MELTVINSRASEESHAYLLKHDSTYGTLDKKVEYGKGYISVDKEKISVTCNDLPAEISWKKYGVDVVIDSTGKFRKSSELAGHLSGGARYVALSAPAKDDTKTVVLGVNDKTINFKSDRIVSNSSCTTNCLATTIKVLHENLKIQKSVMTTVHAVTDSQNLLDNSHKKEVRLRRAAFSSMIPASTGSAKDIGKLYPDLIGKITCKSLRVPLPTVSMIILTAEVEKSTDKDEVNSMFNDAAHSYLKGILSVTSEELVSSDFKGNPYSSVVDPFLTEVVGGNLVTVYAWYDNEWGYTNRLVDLVELLGGK